MEFSKEEIKKVLDKYSDIEKKVGEVKVHTESSDTIGEVVKNFYTVYVASFMYAVTEYESGSFFGIKVSQCSGSMGVGGIPQFQLMESAKDHADTGFSGQVEALAELYMTIGILSISDVNFINDNYKILLDQAKVEMKKERIQFAISEAVKKEDFQKASKLRKELDEL